MARYHKVMHQQPLRVLLSVLLLVTVGFLGGWTLFFQLCNPIPNESLIAMGRTPWTWQGMAPFVLALSVPCMAMLLLIPFIRCDVLLLLSIASKLLKLKSYAALGFLTALFLLILGALYGLTAHLD